MSDDQKHKLPYKVLGSRLKRLREMMRETLAEVSGAVEIETKILENYENGEKRPSEDILELLISHFNIKDDEASKLWKLAGYEQEATGFDADDNQQPTVMVMPFDVRISYTDMANVSVNQYGVIINYMQSVGPNNQPMIVSRLGMSREHATSVVDMLQKALMQTEPKQLSAPDQTTQQQDSETTDK